MRPGWKALLAGSATALIVAVAGFGCGEAKDSEKAQNVSGLKPLPPPDAPGAGGKPPDSSTKGKKTTTGGASAAGAGSQ